MIRNHIHKYMCIDKACLSRDTQLCSNEKLIVSRYHKDRQVWQTDVLNKKPDRQTWSKADGQTDTKLEESRNKTPYDGCVDASAVHTRAKSVESKITTIVTMTYWDRTPSLSPTLLFLTPGWLLFESEWPQVTFVILLQVTRYPWSCGCGRRDATESSFTTGKWLLAEETSSPSISSTDSSSSDSIWAAEPPLSGMTERVTDKKTDRETDSQPDRETDSQTDRQINR